MSVLSLQLFGPMMVQVNGEPLPRLKTRKGQWLLALLTLRAGREVERNWLAGTLWPDAEEENALLYLRQTLTDLRRALGAEAKRIQSPSQRTLCLDLAGAEVDLLTFEKGIARGETASLEQAVAVYRGPLLEGCAEEWVLTEREAQEQAYLGALETLASQALATGDASSAARRLRLIVAADPLRESAFRTLMEALATTRDFAAVTEIYRELRLLLRRELNAEPAAETQALFQSIRASAREQAETTKAPSAGKALETNVSSPTPASAFRHLPRPLSAFIGRAHEIEAAKRWLLTNRLVTLTGIGGVGKTRLAIRVAEETADEFPDGVWFVDFAPLADPMLLPRAVAHTLELSEAAGVSSQQSLLQHLRERHLLLVFDNCEHVLQASAELVTALLQACPRLYILATSRQRLGLAGEVERRLPPLECPASEPGEAEKSDSSLLDYEAVRLFVERARLVQPEWRLDTPAVATIADICRRLDGIPLAIELAAARMGALGVEQIAARLNERFRLLVGGNRTAQPRQQTLRSLLDWSYDLLSEGERILLRRLSVFAGGWTLEAAETVCADPTEGMAAEGEIGLDAWEVLELLAGLVEKSLVVAEPMEDRTLRYRLLETVRQYAGEKLRNGGELTTLQTRHGDFFLTLAEKAGAYLSGPEQTDWLDRLELEHDNLRVAMDFWSDAPRGISRGMRLAGSLQKFWRIRGYVAEGRRRYAALLEKDTEALATSARALTLQGAGNMAMHQGDYKTARQYLEKALVIRQGLSDLLGEADNLYELGNISLIEGDYREAQETLERALSLYRTIRDTQGQSTCLGALANRSLRIGETNKAQQLYEQALVLAREASNVGVQASILNALGMIEVRRSEDAKARLLFEQSLALHRELGDIRHQIVNLNNLGDVTRKLGDTAGAMAYYQDALRLAQQQGEGRAVRVLCFLLEGIAAPMLDLGQPERATRLLSAGLALRERIGAALTAYDAEEYEAFQTKLRGAMEEEIFVRAWAEGQRMTLTEAIDYALEPTDAEVREG